MCLLVTVGLDAAAPGGASSNRSWGVDTAPGAPPQPRHSPGSSGIQSALSGTGPRPPSVKRERERELGRGPRRELLKIKGGSRPGQARLRTRHCNAADCRAEYSPQFPFLIIFSQFASAVLIGQRCFCIFYPTITPSHWGNRNDCERMCRLSLFLQLALSTLKNSPHCCGSKVTCQKERNVERSDVTRAS